jgi:hypothetical protein
VDEEVSREVESLDKEDDSDNSKLEEDEPVENGGAVPKGEDDE